MSTVQFVIGRGKEAVPISICLAKAKQKRQHPTRRLKFPQVVESGGAVIELSPLCARG